MRTAADILRQLTTPMAFLVASAVAAAWYVTWSTAGLVMDFTNPSMPRSDPAALAVFLGLLTVMMVAMMLPGAVPMLVAYYGFTKLEAGRPTKPADAAATALFVLPYFLVWGAFALLALMGLMALGLLGRSSGASALVPAATLVAAGLYQFTRPKEVCLLHCQSPMLFVTRHWRPGRRGALVMGFVHSLYCIGCCWLFMVVLFIVGSMSLLWMGIVSIAIFAEKVEPDRKLVSRATGVILLVLGGLAGRALLPG